jgi:DNA-binding winged helix-turn-helix (wHTH) protein
MIYIRHRGAAPDDIEKDLDAAAPVRTHFAGSQAPGKRTSVGEREAADIVGCKRPAAGRCVLILLGKGHVDQERTLGFARITEHPGQAHDDSSPVSRAMADDGVHGNLQFGPFELSSRERVLRRDGVMLPLGGRALDILIYLAERPGEVIAKEELIEHVWPDVTVGEGSLRFHLAAIRKALGDGQSGNRYITNIKGRGYAFVGTVVPLAGSTKTPNARFRHEGRPGRETAAGEVGDALRDGRSVTRLGASGVGTATLSLDVGRAVVAEFGGKVCLVDLESLADSRHGAGSVAKSLGLGLESKDIGLELIELVRLRKLLVVLDRCEQVIELVALHWGPVRR